MKLKTKNSWLFFSAREINVGNLGIGGKNPIRIQSMTNTPTSDVDATAKQCAQIFDQGGELVRITARNILEAKKLSEIRKKLINNGYHQPLAADIHFNPKIAIEAASRIEKIRINPGNFVNIFPNKKNYSNSEYEQEIDEIRQTIIPLINICKKNGTAIRVGINGGSIGNRIISRYGNTTEGLVESAIEYIGLFVSENFHNLVISLKTSDAPTMIRANRLLAQRCIEQNFNYPIHLGVTEAGEGEDGRMKSAVGIGSLIIDGIGNTIRVSLTEKPEKEIEVAKNIILSAEKNIANKEIAKTFFSKINPFAHNTNHFEIKTNQKPTISVSETESEADISIDTMRLKVVDDICPIEVLWSSKNTSITDFSIVAGSFFSDGYGNKILVNNCNEKNLDAASDLLQICGRKITKAIFTSCPSCGRTAFGIEKILSEVKTEFSNMKGIHFAVMGCIVNGPGEMKGAKYGILGSKPEYVDIYVDGKPAKKGIHQDLALQELKIIVQKNEK